MALSSQLYCNNCGAANQDQAEHCFVCEVPLHTPAKEPLLKERYRILVPVGQGGFGAVYKVEDTHEGNRHLALKEINLSALTSQEVIEATAAFNREVTLLSGLTFPNLPRIHDFFTDREHWYLVTDFIEGETLEQYLKRTRNGRLSLKEVLDIGIQLCRVLDYLHTREPSFIFRDLKPANVMRTLAGHLYLIDFGIARHFKPGQPRDTIPLGSPGYAAPEQYGRAQTTPRADIYSLGALLHQLLTGNNPAQNPFRFELSPLQGQSIPHRLQSLVMQMVEMDVNNRPSSMVIAKQELEQIVATSQPVGTLLSICNHYRLVLTLAWSPDGTYIVSGTANNALHIWNATTGCHMFTYRDPFKTYAWTSSLAWSPDGEYIACGNDDRTVRVWQVEKDVSVTMKQKFTYRGHANWVNAVAWAPDGRRIASGSDDKTVQVWQMGSTATVAETETYHGHSNWVNTVAWSPDGTRIASGGRDKTVQVWDAVTGHVMFTYHDHSSWVYTVAWSPDGTRIASAGNDGTVQVWQAV